MNAEQIAQVMADAVGNPSSGAIAEAIPALSKAVADALAPEQAPEQDAKRSR